jgi:hypothetical protein
MRKVYICAPLAGDVAANIEHAKAYAHFALKCGTAPIVPHFYALLLDDTHPDERALAMRAASALLWICDEIWVFGDTRSPGMGAEMKLAKKAGIRIRTFAETTNPMEGKIFYETKENV